MPRKNQKPPKWRIELAHARALETISLARPNHAQVALPPILTAPELDGSALLALATREHYSDAAAEFVRVVRPQGKINGVSLVGSLFLPPVGLAVVSRIAGHMGEIPRHKSSDIARLGIDDVRRVAARGKPIKANRARVALALLGQPLAPWCELSKRERAGVLLATLVAAWRERAP